MTRHVLYLSFDGMLEPLGYSQVVRYVLELSRRQDLRYTLVSLEKTSDLADVARLARLRERLESHGIAWAYLPYAEGGSSGGALSNLRAMRSLVDQVSRRDRVDLIHARSYLSAAVALWAKQAHRIPYLFDIRGYWIDERAEQGRWFTHPLLYGAAKAFERTLYEQCAGVVSLSKIAAEDIRAGLMGRWPAHKPIALIPTCVDYDEFAIGRPPRPGVVPEAIVRRLSGKLVIGFVGNPGPVYCVDEMMRIVRYALDERPDIHLLALTRHPQVIEARAREHGIDAEHLTLASAPHDEISDWYALMDWGMMLRRRSFSNRAAMPTKMAEFFARGVRPLQYGCNDEVCDWVAHAGSGHVINALSDGELRRAAQVICATNHDAQVLTTARWRTQAHFDLKSGIARYGAIIDEVSKPTRARMRVLFLTEGESVPASRFRVEQFVPHLEKRGIRCTVRPAYGEAYNRIHPVPVLNKVYKLLWSLKRVPASFDARKFDLLFLQRPALPFSPWPEKFAAGRNPRAIFDVDDAIFMNLDGSVNPANRRTFEEAIAACALTICGNDFLADHAREHGPTTVIPTVIDTSRYVPRVAPDDTGEVVIGWMGTASNFPCLRMIVPALREVLAARPKARVRIVSNAVFDDLVGVDRVEQIPWSAAEEIPLLQSFDIGLMPLPDVPVVYGKCGFKMIQYMAVGIPVIASAVGANEAIFDGSDAGALIAPHRDAPVEETEAWRQALLNLIDAPELRRKMGRRGRRHVLARYSIDAVIDRYVELFERVAGIPPGQTAREQDTPAKVEAVEDLGTFSLRALLSLIAFPR
jgi:glycosyltransferase involved in cell wall biosynthesis